MWSSPLSVHTGGQAARFDGNTGRHYHIRCVACGRVNDLPLSVDTRIEEEAGRAMSHRALGHHVEVHGLCPLCQGVPAGGKSSRSETKSSQGR